MTAQEVGLRADPHDGLEVGERVVGRLGEEMRHQRVAADVAEQHRIAVGGRLGDVVGGDRPAGAAAVVDDKGLTEILAELAAQPACDVVLRAAGRERADDAHAALGPVVALCPCRRRKRPRGERQRAQRSSEFAPPHVLFLSIDDAPSTNDA